jgi:hypothetical protein
MAVGFPPQPVYPNGLDSDRTLFLVYNTSEVALAEDSEPWGENITIVPRSKTQSEIWADNGFANISGELFYYDAVDKDANGKIYKLKRCARNLGGVPTQFNEAGTMVRGFVVAEHHNQLVDGIILVEQFIGENFSEDTITLDYRIRQLRAVPIIFDDFGCPDVNFFFTTISSDPSSGTVVHYKIEVTGSFNEFTLTFGDGTSTSSIQEDDHIYPPNANIDPVVTFKNNRCQVVQTSVLRDSVDAPTAPDLGVNFDSPNSPTFNFPNINIIPPVFPETDINIPPFQFPCIDLSPLGIATPNIPSVIMFVPPINLPSFISFDDITIPSFIAFGPISIPNISIEVPDIHLIVPDIPNISLIIPPISIPAISIPDFSVTATFPNLSLTVTFPSLSVTANFPTLSVAVPTFPSISIAVPTFPNISVVFPTPTISVNWGTPPISSIPVDWGTPPVTSFTMNWGTPPVTSFTMNWGTPPTVMVSWTAPPTVAVQWGTPPNVSVTYGVVPYVSMAWGTPPAVSMAWGTPPTVSVAWGSVPQLTVNWGNPPTIQVNVTLTCPSTPLALAAADPVGMAEDMMGIGKNLEVNYDITGFPSEIRLIPPDIPDVRIIHDIPSEITVRTPTFPDVKFDVPEFRNIQILAPETQLTIEAIGIPNVLRLVPTQFIPERIELAVPVRIPDRIVLESNLPDVIRIEGMPDVIRLEHNLPSTIKLEMPDKPEIELVYKGSPIPVQIQLDIQKLIGDQDNLQCVAIVPCRKS